MQKKRAVGQPQLAQDQRFATQALRTRHIAELLETMSGYVARKDTAYWLASCEQLEIPAAPVTRMDDLPHDPHLQATGFCREERRSDGGCEISAFVRAHQGSQPPIGMPPRLGEHTQALLREAGWDDARIAALQSKDC